MLKRINELHKITVCDNLERYGWHLELLISTPGGGCRGGLWEWYKTRCLKRKQRRLWNQVRSWMGSSVFIKVLSYWQNACQYEKVFLEKVVFFASIMIGTGFFIHQLVKCSLQKAENHSPDGLPEKIVLDLNDQFLWVGWVWIRQNVAARQPRTEQIYNWQIPLKMWVQNENTHCEPWDYRKLSQ